MSDHNDPATEQDIINQLIAVRHQNGLLQRDVADIMCVTRQNVTHFERLTHSPTLSSILRYAAAVGAKVNVEAATE